MEFFAGANTVNGFKSLFEECFAGISRLYILKGSSGCGKSTLMRRIAGRAQREGIDFDIIRCSADPESLDGVILPSLSVAVADGTSPHLLDVKYPCVRESIINLGQFWDEAKIIPHREKIISLTDKKSERYKSAYAALAAYGRVLEMIKLTVNESILNEKLDEFALSFTDKLSSSGEKNKRLLCSAFTSEGVKTLESFGKIQTLYRINGIAAQQALNALHRTANERGIHHTAICSSLDISQPESLYFEQSSVLVTVAENPPCASFGTEKTTSSARFIDKGKISDSRARLKTLNRLANELLDDAKSELALARATHYRIEELYIPAMNFELLDEFTAKLINSIFANK